MSNEFYTYITKENDRWDLIAHRFYGDSHQYEIIIKANPKIKITPILESGIKLKIPVLNQNNQIKAPLPPWRN